MTTVLLLDDHELVRRGLRELLNDQEDLTVVADTGTGAEAIRLARETMPDVAVLDVRLPDESGVMVCRDIRSEFPSVQCLMLTSYNDDEALVDAVAAGASGYVLKQVNGDELLTAIRTVARGESLMDPDIVESIREGLLNPDASDERLAHLTDQERRILNLLAAGRSNRQIAEELFLAEKTVKNYVSNLLAKMGMHGRTEAAVYAARLLERREARSRGGT